MNDYNELVNQAIKLAQRLGVEVVRIRIGNDTIYITNKDYVTVVTIEIPKSEDGE